MSADVRTAPLPDVARATQAVPGTSSGRSMKVAVLGASGFVGAHVVDALIDGGHQALAVVRPGSRRPADRDGMEVVTADPLGPAGSIADLLAHETDGIINAAGRTLGSRTQLVTANGLFVAAVLDGLKGIPRPGDLDWSTSARRPSTTPRTDATRSPPGTRPNHAPRTGSAS